MVTSVYIDHAGHTEAGPQDVQEWHVLATHDHRRPIDVPGAADYDHGYVDDDGRQYMVWSRVVFPARLASCPLCAGLPGGIQRALRQLAEGAARGLGYGYTAEYTADGARVSVRPTSPRSEPPHSARAAAELVACEVRRAGHQARVVAGLAGRWDVELAP